MQRLALLLLLLPACSTVPDVPVDAGADSSATVGDGAVGVDSGIDAGADAFALAVDAGLDAAIADDAWADDAATADDAWAASDTRVAPTDAYVAHDANAMCGDGFIDATETCDPGLPGRTRSVPGTCATTTVGSDPPCTWCAWGRIGTTTGCVLGGVGDTGTGWSSACTSSTDRLRWVTWHSASERDDIIAAYRYVATIGGAPTNVVGWIGLRAAGDSSPFLWVDGLSTGAGASLPFHNARTTGTNCVTLTVTDTDAYLRYVTCTGGAGLCISEPWGTAR